MKLEKSTPISYPLSYRHILRFDSDIEDLEYYNHFCDVLLAAQPNDVVEMYFGSDGGSASTCIHLLNLMNQCKCQIDGYLLSDAHSAASILFLHCDNQYVGRYTSMLVHGISFGVGGGLPAIKAHVNHTAKQAELLLRETYEGFLTEEELRNIIDHDDQLYLDHDQIADRLKKRYTYLEDKDKQTQLSDYLDSIDADAQEVVPVDALKKLTKAELIAYIQGDVTLTPDEKGGYKVTPYEEYTC